MTTNIGIIQPTEINNVEGLYSKIKMIMKEYSLSTFHSFKFMEIFVFAKF